MRKLLVILSIGILPALGCARPHRKVRLHLPPVLEIMNGPDEEVGARPEYLGAARLFGGRRRCKFWFDVEFGGLCTFVHELGHCAGLGEAETREMTNYLLGGHRCEE